MLMSWFSLRSQVHWVFLQEIFFFSEDSEKGYFLYFLWIMRVPWNKRKKEVGLNKQIGAEFYQNSLHRTCICKLCFNGFLQNLVLLVLSLQTMIFLQGLCQEKVLELCFLSLNCWFSFDIKINRKLKCFFY